MAVSRRGALAILIVGAIAVVGVVAFSTGLIGTPGSSPLAAAPTPSPGGLGSTEPSESTSSLPPGSLGLGSPAPSPSASPGYDASAPFPAGVLIADRGNGRIIAVSNAGQILWQFPRTKADLPSGQGFSADDAFIDPSGKTIVANDEFHEVIDRIDIATGRIVWQYGRYNSPGPAIGQLNTPDDAYPLANGNIIVADIRNCRILEIAPDKTIVRTWGRTRVCIDNAGHTYGEPNGDTPLPDGGLLITEITGSRVVRLAADGSVVFDIHVPVAYPSDAQLDANGNVVVSDFSTHGQVVAVTPTGALLWRYAPVSGDGRLNHPSLATPLPNGLVSINDDFRDRVIVIDPMAGTIVWRYGVNNTHGTKTGYLNTPDGHQPFGAGIFTTP
ncbi:MAG TPA: PQQ-binding-like beta-propeller repeat protein [Candidatus Limnocylindrales bacterium]|nr:PQQ-binding-like beta-propeller repeat protein [Candidatus Limnocylindrales bacterium]